MSNTPSVNSNDISRIERSRLLSQGEDVTMTFFVYETGKTCGARVEITNQLENGGMKETMEIQVCDFVLALCPIVSRAGCDIADAEKEIPVEKPVVLMVLHHTLNPHAVVPGGNKLVTRKDVLLTVDSLFHESEGFLKCSRNNTAIRDVLREGRSLGQVGPSISHRNLYIIAAFVTIVVVILGSIGLNYALKNKV